MFDGKRLILYELNEVPLRVIQWFRSRYPNSAIASLIEHGALLETYTEDDGHLSPWITWPTLHRGVTNRQHHISDFGQDLTAVNEAYPSLWELVARSGRTVGVFGSLHSYPLPHVLDNYAFYVPDTFARGIECFPSKFEVFQDLNLNMLDRSGRNVSSGVPIRQAARFLAAAPKLGLRATTAAKLAAQLIAEKAKPNRVVRRRTSQVQIAFDFFLSELKRTQPEFTTFFTNHVASSMHRYWPALFPQDYVKPCWDAAWRLTWKDEIPFAMREADAQLSELMRFVQRDHRYALLVATSMGQAAAQENAQVVETQLNFYNIKHFMRMLAIPDDAWHRERAMAPLYMVRIDARLENDFADRLSQVRINAEPLTFASRGQGVFRIELGQINLTADRTAVTYAGRPVSLTEAGMVNLRIQDEAGSNAYHVPEGVLIAFSGDHRHRAANDKVSTIQVAPSVLRNFGIAPPSYMADAIAA